MKRIIVILLGLLVLVGCQSTPKSVSKACSLEMLGMKATIKALAESEEADIDEVEIAMEIPYIVLGIDGSGLTDEVKEAISTQMESSLLSLAGLEQYRDYTEVSQSELNDEGMAFGLVLDIKKFIEDNGSTGEDLSFNNFITTLEASGMTCE